MSAVWAAAGRAGERAAAGRGLAVAARRRDRRRPGAPAGSCGALAYLEFLERRGSGRTTFGFYAHFKVALNDLTSRLTSKNRYAIFTDPDMFRVTWRDRRPATGNEACLGAKEASRSVPTVEAANEVL